MRRQGQHVRSDFGSQLHHVGDEDIWKSGSGRPVGKRFRRWSTGDFWTVVNIGSPAVRMSVIRTGVGLPFRLSSCMLTLEKIRKSTLDKWARTRCPRSRWERSFGDMLRTRPSELNLRYTERSSGLAVEFCKGLRRGGMVLPVICVVAYLDVRWCEAYHG